MRRRTGRFGFADHIVAGAVGAGVTELDRALELIDWAALDRRLDGLLASSSGRPAWPPLVMAKILLLQHWYGLSDPATEAALADRLSFRRFCGLALDEGTPDHSTISRFRSRLAAAGLGSLLFDEIGRQLAERGYVVRQGTLIDASLVRPAAKEPHKQKGGGRSAVDPDANWTKRGAVAHFGYKLHVAVDQGTGLVRAARLTPANVNDCVLGPELVQGDEAAVYADMGYDSASLRGRLAETGAADRVMRRPNRRVRRLGPEDLDRNARIARVRGRIEGVFGTLKQHFGLSRLRYFGLERNTLAVFAALAAWNLSRACRTAA